MMQIATTLRNNKFLYKIEGKFAPFAHVFKNRLKFNSPFIVRGNNKIIAIVLSYIDKSEPDTLWIRKIWINPRIFSGSGLVGANNRHPYFESLTQVLNLYMQSCKPITDKYKIDKIRYKVYNTSDEDQALLNTLLWYGFNLDMDTTIREFVPTTSWRDKENLSFKVYTRRIV